ncbi:MAG: hypothetical protein HY774_17015 [Acidobacteria bacterium]|nr:hypothetical protein [Acidobacteriota bacterium]
MSYDSIIRTPETLFKPSILAEVLSTFGADDVKRIAVTYLGKGTKLNKADCIKALTKALVTPKAIHQAVADFSDFERTALGLIKLRGQSWASVEELALECLMLKPEKLPADLLSRGYYSTSHKHYGRLNELLRKGIVFPLTGNHLDLSSYHHSFEVAANPLVLNEIRGIQLPSLSIQPVDGPQLARFVKRPSEIVLRLVAFEQAITKVGAMNLTAKGIPAKTIFPKLQKLLGWEDSSKSPFAFTDPVAFFFWLFRAAGVLQFQFDVREVLVLRQNSPISQPYLQQVTQWLKAYRSIVSWHEPCPPGLYLYYRDEDRIRETTFNGFRAALLLALGMLPDPTAWYRISHLSEALYGQLGYSFTLGRNSNSLHFWREKSLEEKKRAIDEWKASHRKNWDSHDEVFIRQALYGPLFQLGVVEFAGDDDKPGQPGCFRLTEVGRVALARMYGQSVESSSTKFIPQPDKPCWLIQPNFDVMVYLESASAEQLSLIERVGSRQHVDASTATYRLTRDATYQALESGLNIEGIIRQLQASSLKPMPEAVIRSMTDWASRRERLSVHLNAQVLEFESAQAREKALKSGQVTGEPIGDTFLLVTSAVKNLSAFSVIAYEPALPRCISVEDTGRILVHRDLRDLLIVDQLSELAEPIGTDQMEWHITEKSVRAAMKKGWTVSEILNQLHRRVNRNLPPVLNLAIQCWGGAALPEPTTLKKQVVLQLPTHDLAEAIANSSHFMQFIGEQIGPRAFLIPDVLAEMMHQLLIQYGFIEKTTPLNTDNPTPQRKKKQS